jgi:hypothetical protein
MIRRSRRLRLGYPMKVARWRRVSMIWRQRKLRMGRWIRWRRGCWEMRGMLLKARKQALKETARGGWRMNYEDIHDGMHGMIRRLAEQGKYFRLGWR